MASQILTAHKQRLESMELQPSSGGCFELTIDGDLVYSKLATEEFPDEALMVKEVEAALEAKNL